MSIEVVELSKVYGQQRAVDQISFKVKPGEITGFLGPNGAGKSTTMKIATGFIKPTTGDVLMNDVSVSENPMQVKRITGYLPEHNPMYLDMYIQEYLDFIGRAYGLKRHHRRQRIREVLQLCGLGPEQHKRILALSKGYRQRVGLAKALLADPSILVLDEPTTGLDPNQILEIRDVIRGISVNKTVILSTHIMQEVEALCEHVVIINKGKLVADRKVAELRSAQRGHRLEVTFEAPVALDLFRTMEGIDKLELVSDCVIRIESARDIRNEVLSITTHHSLPLTALRDPGNSLEEIFHELTKSSPA